jgi:hypothetical protein
LGFQYNPEIMQQLMEWISLCWLHPKRVLVVRLSTESFISKFWYVWESWFLLWDQNCSPTSASCTMTARSDILPFPSRSFCQDKLIVVLKYLACSSDIALCNISPFLTMKNNHQGSDCDITSKSWNSEVRMGFHCWATIL